MSTRKEKNTTKESTVSSGRDIHIGDKNKTINVNNTTNTIPYNLSKYILYILISTIMFISLNHFHSRKGMTGKFLEISIRLVNANNGEVIPLEGKLNIYSVDYEDQIYLNSDTSSKIVETPHRLLGERVQFMLESSDWTLDTKSHLLSSNKNTIRLLLSRKATVIPIQGIILTKGTNEPVKNVIISFQDTTLISDADGEFTLQIPDYASEEGGLSLTLEKKGFISETVSLDYVSTPQQFLLSPEVIKPRSVKLLDLLSSGFENPAKQSRAIFPNDTLPLAFIDDAYKIGNERKAMRNHNACIYTFTISNSTKETVTIDQIYVQVNDYQPMQPYDLSQRMAFTESKVAYIRIGSDVEKPYPVNFYVIEGERHDVGKITLPPATQEVISVRINAEQPGIYTIDGTVLALDQSGRGTQKLKLFRNVQWLFDKE